MRRLTCSSDEDWLVVLPLGPLEYHGQHMSVGTDTLAVVKTAERLEPEMDMVVLPTFYYGPASYAVEPPELKGSVQVEAEHLIPVAKDMFRSLLRIGFRSIHFFIHHQSENFCQGMPTDLAFRTGARLAIFEFLEKERGEGWWGDNQMASYRRLIPARGRGSGRVREARGSEIGAARLAPGRYGPTSRPCKRPSWVKRQC